MIPRLFVDAELRMRETLELPDEHGRYLRQVLRRAPGDAIILFNGKGGEYAAEIVHLGKHRACVAIRDYNPVSREMQPPVHIIQAACRNEKVEHVLQKGVELGAASFQIVRSERSQLRLDGRKLEQRLNRWRKIIIEAAEQSGRTMVPALAWRPKLADLHAEGMTICLHPEGLRPWHELRRTLDPASPITLAVGPEGGWGETDLAQLKQQGFETMRFGPRILRTETAAPALLAAIYAVCSN